MEKDWWPKVQAIRTERDLEKLKRSRGECVVVELKDGRLLDLGHLDGAYLLLCTFLRWYVRNFSGGATNRV